MYKCWVFKRRVIEVEWVFMGLNWGLGLAKRFKQLQIGLLKWRLTLNWSRMAECATCGYAVPVPSDAWCMCSLAVVSEGDEMVEPYDYCDRWISDRDEL